MDKLSGPNIRDAGQFSEKLQEAMNAINELLELSKEYELKPVGEDGARRYYENDGKCCFQVSGQYERPVEFLQALLDMIRVNFEPHPMGTFFLNSNMGFMYDAIPDEPFQLAYASLVSEENQSFSSFYENDVTAHLGRCGYDVETITAMFAVASTGRARYKINFSGEISKLLNSGFSVSDGLDLLASELEAAASSPRKQTYAGYCLVPELGSRIRLSLWCFVKRSKTNIH